MSGVTVNPVPGRTAGDGLADLGEVFGGKAQFARVPGHFPLSPAVLLDRHQESQEMAGGDIFNLRLFDFPRIDIPHIIEENGQQRAHNLLSEKGSRSAYPLKELPAYKGDVDVTPYDVIFIGGPIWWGTYPQVMFTFFKDHDLSGKTVIPFTPHEGSGLASTVQDVKKTWPEATVKDGFAIYGHEVRSGRAKVEKWLKGLGW